MSKTVLIIEDDPNIMSILEILFSEEGFSPILKPNGTSTEEVMILQPDLILLDVRIKGSTKNGAEICTALKSSPGIGQIPVMLVSAENNLDLIAKDCRADAFITKPFNLDLLIDRVKELLY
ncbi:response regulator [Pedobacter sp. AW31-3R]|uniref:response regulator n=1 Tax=Pedobacter sp. AW31-3R TaxID=3445781 RepID=UPI003FA0946C